MTISKVHYKTWLEKYKPDFAPDGTLLDYMPLYQMAPNKHMWTDLGNGDIVPGRQFVNRFAYYRTEIPWEDDAIVVTEFVTKEDYLQRIIEVEEDDPDYAEELWEKMMEEFGDGV